MSVEHTISEKARVAEKRGKPADPASKLSSGSRAAQKQPVTPAPLPGLQSPEEFVANIMRSVEATGQVTQERFAQKAQAKTKARA